MIAKKRRIVHTNKDFIVRVKQLNFSGKKRNCRSMYSICELL